jgi:hypothetical protein
LRPDCGGISLAVLRALAMRKIGGQTATSAVPRKWSPNSPCSPPTRQQFLNLGAAVSAPFTTLEGRSPHWRRFETDFGAVAMNRADWVPSPWLYSPTPPQPSGRKGHAAGGLGDRTQADSRGHFIVQAKSTAGYLGDGRYGRTAVALSYEDARKRAQAGASISTFPSRSPMASAGCQVN